MRIAQIAPLTEAIPPKLYGGTERVIYWLTEELVALGHDVTLFASGDSRTSAKLAGLAGALRLDAAVRDPCPAHGDAGAGAAAGGRIRRAALPSRLLSVLAVFAPIDAVPDHAPRPSRPAGAPAGVPTFSSIPCRFHPTHSGNRAASTAGSQRSITACRNTLTPQPVNQLICACFGRISPRKGRRSRDPHCRALRLAAQIAAKVDRVERIISREQIDPLLDLAAFEYIGESATARSRPSSAAPSRCSCRSIGPSRSAW